MVLTSHAACRLGQRGIMENELALVMKFATKIHNGGALFLFMRRKDIPDYLPPAQQDRLEGIVVVMDPLMQTVITIYKNRNGLKDIKRKEKRFVARRAA